ncbi:MAG: hypothetical protein UV45_C0029G0003 [Candidatus Azambacteria bacterium GW2011_GWB1_42_72]|nr:MAG: hypothetical protein UV45_C0029G0003 [Candidatus Azambacteria bacterium GW2011_GWB1_42_72]
MGRQDGITEFILTFHAENLGNRDLTHEALGYPMITKKGEADTRKKAQILLRVVNSLPAGGVLALCGFSKAVRTHSTLAVYADELRKLLNGGRDIVFFQDPSSAACAKTIGDHIKIIQWFPMEMNEFVSEPGKKEMENVFRFYFSGRYLTLFSVGHSVELGALVEFLSKKGAEKYNARVRYSFM